MPRASTTSDTPGNGTPSRAPDRTFAGLDPPVATVVRHMRDLAKAQRSTIFSGMEALANFLALIDYLQADIRNNPRMAHEGFRSPEPPVVAAHLQDYVDEIFLDALQHGPSTAVKHFVATLLEALTHAQEKLHKAQREHTDELHMILQSLCDDPKGTFTPQKVTAVKTLYQHIFQQQCAQIREDNQRWTENNIREWRAARAKLCPEARPGAEPGAPD